MSETMGNLNQAPARSAVDGLGFRSLWLDEALAAETDGGVTEPLEGDVRTDVCIVGAGYTGLWTALELRRRAPSLDIRVIDREVAGAGASGRNGGFILSWWSKFATLKKICGEAEALRTASVSSDAIGSIRDFCVAHGIDAHFRQDGWLWTATSPTQLSVLKASLAELRHQGSVPLVEVSAAETARRSGSAVHLAGVLEPEAATIQPALLARGLRRVVLEAGIPIYERTPMVRLERGTPVTVVTPRGRIKADAVLLAMNAWLAQFREARQALVVIGSDMVATEPIPQGLSNIGWTDGLGITDSRRLVHYYRTTLDGRIVFGKGGGALAHRGLVGTSFDGESRRSKEVERHLRRTYPQLGTTQIAKTWTGPIDYSVTGLPFFAPFPGRPDIVCAAGYSGNGIGPSFVGAQVLADLVLRAENEWAASPLLKLPSSHLPPEPFRYLGGRIVRRAIAAKERREDDGGRAGWLLRTVASFDPTSFVDLGRTATDGKMAPSH